MSRWTHRPAVLGIAALLLTSCATTDVGSAPAGSTGGDAASQPATDEPQTAEAILAECTDAVASDEPIELTLRAADHAFDADHLEGVGHCQPFSIVLVNEDPGVLHNVEIEVPGLGGPTLFSGELIEGGSSATYEIPPLPAGEYRFICTPHSAVMSGTLAIDRS